MYIVLLLLLHHFLLIANDAPSAFSAAEYLSVEQKVILRVASITLLWVFDASSVPSGGSGVKLIGRNSGRYVIQVTFQVILRIHIHYRQCAEVTACSLWLYMAMFIVWRLPSFWSASVTEHLWVSNNVARRPNNQANGRLIGTEIFRICTRGYAVKKGHISTEAPFSFPRPLQA